VFFELSSVHGCKPEHRNAITEILETRGAAYTKNGERWLLCVADVTRLARRPEDVFWIIEQAEKIGGRVLVLVQAGTGGGDRGCFAMRMAVGSALIIEQRFYTGRYTFLYRAANRAKPASPPSEEDAVSSQQKKSCSDETHHFE
jgi:hypothetical protein